jgi:hypothetical protein
VKASSIPESSITVTVKSPLSIGDSMMTTQSVAVSGTSTGATYADSVDAYVFAKSYDDSTKILQATLRARPFRTDGGAPRSLKVQFTMVQPPGLMERARWLFDPAEAMTDSTGFTVVAENGESVVWTPVDADSGIAAAILRFDTSLLDSTDTKVYVEIRAQSSDSLFQAEMDSL